MNKEEKEKAEKAIEFDPALLVGKKLKELAAAWGKSVNTFKRDIEAIKDQLMKIKREVRPGCKRGAQGATYKEVMLIIGHIGIPKNKVFQAGCSS